MRARFYLKVSGSLLSAVFLYQVAGESPAIQDLVLGCRAAALEKVGSDAQRERLLDDVRRAAAARADTMAEAEGMIAFREAVESHRRLVAMDPGLAASALEIAIHERDEATGK